MKQENFFKSPVKDMNTVFKISLAMRGKLAGGSGGVARRNTVRIEFNVGLIGKEPIESDENEVGKDLLFDTALGLGVKVLDDEEALADLVKLLDTPAAMVDIDEGLQRITLRIEQRGPQAKHAVADFAFEQS